MRRGGRERRTPDLILYSGAEAVALTGGRFWMCERREEPLSVLRAAAAATE